MSFRAWKYYTEIIIDNSFNSNNLVDFQIPIVLDQSNFDFSLSNYNGYDLRIVEEDKLTELPYWLKFYNPFSQRAEIYVKLSISAGQTKKLYLFFGNYECTTTSNPYSVLELYDNFDSSTLNSSRWAVINSSNGTIEISDSQIWLASSYAFNNKNDRGIFITPQNHIIPSTYKVVALNNTLLFNGRQAIIGLRSSHNIHSAEVYIGTDNDASHINLYHRPSYNVNIIKPANNTGMTIPSAPRLIEIIYYGSTKTAEFYVNNRFLNLQTNSSWDLEYPFIADSAGSDKPNIFDWIFVVKYSDYMPNVYVSPHVYHNVSTFYVTNL